MRHPDLDIEYVHRTDRTGFKAGALENGLRTAKGELVLIFDADFVPNPDILERTVHHFLDPKVAVVQCRWEHINRDFSALTEAQALMLNGHFIMEHAGRNRSGRFFNFNGTAGMWRRAAIVDAGGWHHDTLTEDMDLSYRAQLRGWRFVYLPDIAAPAELPVEMSAFKAQQFRWAKGSIQVARKLLPRILRSRATLAQKTEAFFHLTNNFAYPLLLLLSLLLLPNLIVRTTHGVREVLMIDLPLFFGTTLSDRVVLSRIRTRNRAAARGSLAHAVEHAAPPAPGSVDRDRAVREPDARGVRGLAGARDRVRAHPQARHPGQVGKLVEQALPRGPVVDPDRRVAHGRLLLGCSRGRGRARPLPVGALPAALPLRFRLCRDRVGLAGLAGPVPASHLAARGERARDFPDGRAPGCRHARLHARPGPAHIGSDFAEGSVTSGWRAARQRDDLRNHPEKTCACGFVQTRDIFFGRDEGSTLQLWHATMEFATDDQGSHHGTARLYRSPLTSRRRAASRSSRLSRCAQLVASATASGVRFRRNRHFASA